MKKNILLALAFSVTFSIVSFAQGVSTPEVPRNYKPLAKELIPMPDSLTLQRIFPVIGQYQYTNQEGDIAQVTVSIDHDNKGVVWVNGLPQGKFKADLKLTPSTYKIPHQKTLVNDSLSVEVVENEIVDSEEKKPLVFSGKTLDEGTLLFDSSSNRLFVNLGGRYNEADPAAAFPELGTSDATGDVATSYNNTSVATSTAKNTFKKDKKTAPKGTIIILEKLIESAVTIE